MKLGYEGINPTPPYPSGIDIKKLSKFKWDSKSQAVLTFKEILKEDLWRIQMGRCCYCRRFLYEKTVTHLEHFVEKTVYPTFTFEIKNLALSCAVCNSQKNKKFLRLNGFLKKRAKKTGTVAMSYCPALSPAVLVGIVLPTIATHYRWVHPHLDLYSQHISIQKSWIFRGITRKGFRTVNGLNLNALALIEQRAMQDRFASRGGPLSFLVGFLAELNQNKAKVVGAAVAAELRRRRLSVKA